VARIPGSKDETVFQNAIRHWWKSKKVNAKGISQAQGGTRDSNLRGDTMDGFRDVIIDRLLSIGVRRDDIYFGAGLAALASNLPSYFRATKNWDIVVCKGAHHKRLIDSSTVETTLIATIEFKSQEKSIGNNQNNRMEESIGNAHDFWASYENRNFLRLTPRPWLGYLFVGRYGDGDELKTVKIRQPLIPVDPMFGGAEPEARTRVTNFPGPSYAERYKIFLERMIAKKLYDGACFIVTHEDIANGIPNYRILFPQLSGEAFLDALLRHTRAYYPA
jgi:hypothetical protein